MRQLIHGLLMGVACAVAAVGAEQKALNDNQFEEKMHRFRDERDDAGRQREARDLLRRYYFSSLQVKAIAQSLRDDNARLEFATMAYPRTVDPENFYEVYDAFTAFSKVMRLHDRIRQLQPPTPPAVELPRVITNDEIKDILKSLRRESFDNTRGQLARQILTSSRGQFLSSQVKQMLDCFDFEPSKLELAKVAYEFTYDKDKYFLVNDAFSFDATKQALSRYVESWNKESPPRR